jgi:hypothetical protein
VSEFDGNRRLSIADIAPPQAPDFDAVAGANDAPDRQQGGGGGGGGGAVAEVKEQPGLVIKTDSMGRLAAILGNASSGDKGGEGGVDLTAGAVQTDADESSSSVFQCLDGLGDDENNVNQTDAAGAASPGRGRRRDESHDEDVAHEYGRVTATLRWGGAR